MKNIKHTFIALLAVAGLVATPLALTTQVEAAAPCSGVACLNQGSNSATPAGTNTNLRAQLQTVTNILLFLLGAIAVVVIVIGGIKYTTSDGDSSKIQSAKNTILYAIVGIIVALLAFAIVSFVINQFVPAPATP